MKTVHIKAFAVLGKEARTSNAKEMSGKGVIGAMWSAGAPAGLPVVAVYSNYESDKDGEYDYLLGRKVVDDETVPREMAHRIVESGVYVHLSFDGSISPEDVMALWRRIWEAETIGEIKRAYKTDFELYRKDGFDLYVGLKS